MAGKRDKVIDFRESISSISLLKVTQIFENMNPSEVMEIRGADRDTQEDLFKVLPTASYEIVPMEDAENTSSLDTLMIRKCR